MDSSTVGLIIIALGLGLLLFSFLGVVRKRSAKLESDDQVSTHRAYKDVGMEFIQFSNQPFSGHEKFEEHEKQGTFEFNVSDKLKNNILTTFTAKKVLESDERKAFLLTIVEIYPEIYKEFKENYGILLEETIDQLSCFVTKQSKNISGNISLENGMFYVILK